MYICRLCVIEILKSNARKIDINFTSIDETCVKLPNDNPKPKTLLVCACYIIPKVLLALHACCQVILHEVHHGLFWHASGCYAICDTRFSIYWTAFYGPLYVLALMTPTPCRLHNSDVMHVPILSSCIRTCCMLSAPHADVCYLVCVCTSSLP